MKAALRIAERTSGADPLRTRQASSPKVTSRTWNSISEQHLRTASPPTSGFGEGALTLWLPASKAGTEIVFRGGAPVIESHTACDEPDIAQARDILLMAMRGDGFGRGSAVVIALYNYVATMVRRNYNVDDADLSLIVRGEEWHDEIIRHAFCGDDNVAGWASRPPTPGACPAVAAAPEPPAPPTTSPRPQGSGLVRLARAVLRAVARGATRVR